MVVCDSLMLPSCLRQGRELVLGMVCVMPLGLGFMTGGMLALKLQGNFNAML